MTSMPGQTSTKQWIHRGTQPKRTDSENSAQEPVGRTVSHQISSKLDILMLW